MLHDTLTRVDEETVKAVMVSKPIIGITSGAMYLRAHLQHETDFNLFSGE